MVLEIGDLMLASVRSCRGLGGTREGAIADMVSKRRALAAETEAQAGALV